MVLIGLIGKKSSGKTTSSEFLCKKFDYVEYALADPLKQICIILGAPRWSVYGSQEDKERIVPELGVSGRQMMQQIGTELFREQLSSVLPDLDLGYSGRIWIRLLEHKIKSTPNLVVPDIRFMDEAETIIRNGGILIRIKRDGLGDDKHSSEQELDLPNVIEIENNGTQQDLYQNLMNKLNQC